VKGNEEDEEEENAVGQAGSSTRPSRAKPNRAESRAVFGPSSTQLRVSLLLLSFFLFFFLSFSFHILHPAFFVRQLFSRFLSCNPFFRNPFVSTTPDSFFRRLGFPISAVSTTYQLADRWLAKSPKPPANGPANGKTIIPGVPEDHVGSFG